MKKKISYKETHDKPAGLFCGVLTVKKSKAGFGVWKGMGGVQVIDPLE